jgi:hypothetical protein
LLKMHATKQYAGVGRFGPIADLSRVATEDKVTSRSRGLPKNPGQIA